ncbi:hypothetical protein BJX99DRAFT_83259 [Aspergillus californicus]
MDPVNPASLPSEYWSSLDPYGNPDPSQHHSHPTQQQPNSQQPQQQLPLGIGWDHPVLHSSQQPHRDQTHGLYSSTPPPSWHQNPLHHQPIAPSTPHNQTLAMAAQYRQVPQYAHGQVTFDSRSTPSSDNSHFQSYSFSPNFYQPQHISIPDGFSQTHSPQPTQQQSQPTAYQSMHSNSVPQYGIPAGYSGDSQHPSFNVGNGFAQSSPGIPEQTVNPQYINPPQSSTQNTPLYHEYMFTNPSNPAEGPKMYIHLPPDDSFLSLPPQRPPFHANALAKPAQPRAKQPGIKKQSQAKKGSVKRYEGKTMVESSDESSDSDLEIQEPPEPSPILPARPSEPEAAAQYDTLCAVWYPRNKRPNVDKVKNALVAFKDVVKTVRDAWKESASTLKTAENKGETSDTAQLRTQVALQRRVMNVVVSTTLEKAHPVIVEKLGEHPMAVAAIYSFLLDRHQASDIDGVLAVNILKLLARFVTMDEDVLQKTNVAKLLPRFVKKGSQQVKALAQAILNNAAASSKRKQENGKPGSKEGSPAKQAASDATAPDGLRKDSAGAKRLREGDVNGQPATKRVVVTSNIKPVSKPTNLAANGTAKRTQETGQENKVPGAASNISRPKANIIAPKPTNLFGTLSSASKKPGTSNAERAAALAAAKVDPSTDKKDSGRPAFSFGDIMADLNKQKEPSPREVSEDREPETEEERKKRLRKEKRRKLRVTWKPDDVLTEVRFFTHDPEEELGPRDRSRHGGDVKGEGSILKLHKNLDELEEDDDGGMREEQIFEYYSPSEIDVTDLSPEDRDRNNIKRAGTQQPISPEAKAQEHREATTLMMIYTSPADVPSSAKEPPPPDIDEMVPEELPFGELPDHVKARQKQYYALVKPQPAPESKPQPSAQNNQFVFDLLKSIQNPGQQQQSTPPPQVQQPTPTPAFNLEQTISMLRQQQQPPPPQQQPPPPPSIPPAFDQRLLATVFAAQQQAQQSQQPQPQPQPQPQQGAMPPYLAALISQYSNQNQQPAAKESHTGHYENPDRKRHREHGGYESDDGWKHSRLNAPNKKHPKAGSVACRFWRGGNCLKGDDCTFRHDP